MRIKYTTTRLYLKLIVTDAIGKQSWSLIDKWQSMDYIIKYENEKETSDTRLKHSVRVCGTWWVFCCQSPQDCSRGHSPETGRRTDPVCPRCTGVWRCSSGSRTRTLGPLTHLRCSTPVRREAGNHFYSLTDSLMRPRQRTNTMWKRCIVLTCSLLTEDGPR